MYQLTSDANLVVDLSSGAWITVGSSTWQADQYTAWLAAGNTPQPVPAVTNAQLELQLQTAVQQWLDTTAQQNNYDSALSCASYASSGNSQFAADARAMVAWRDAVWVACYAALSSLTSAPTPAAFIASLPQPATYGWLVHVPVQVTP